MDKIYQNVIDEAHLEDVTYDLETLYTRLVLIAKSNDLPIPDEAIRLKEIIDSLKELFSI